MRSAHRASSLALAAALLLGACGGGGGTEPTSTTPPSSTPTTPETNATISIRSSTDSYGYVVNAFTPAAVRLVRGGTVTWTNTSGLTHNVTFAAVPGAPANVPDHVEGQNARTFPTAGTFAFRCSFHDTMSGTITVE